MNEDLTEDSLEKAFVEINEICGNKPISFKPRFVEYTLPKVEGKVGRFLYFDEKQNKHRFISPEEYAKELMQLSKKTLVQKIIEIEKGAPSVE